MLASLYFECSDSGLAKVCSLLSYPTFALEKLLFVPYSFFENTTPSFGLPVFPAHNLPVL